MSEYKRANSFGTGYLDTKDVYKVKFENKTKKRFFEVAGDKKAMTAFGKIPNDPITWKWDKEAKLMLSEGQDYFYIEITTPEGDRSGKFCNKDTYLELLRENGISSDGRWKEWGRNEKTGSPMMQKVVEQ